MKRIYKMKKYNVLLLNGPNLNMLGVREKEIYGNFKLKDLEKNCIIWAKKLGIMLDAKQTNSESKMVELIQKSRDKYIAIIINAGAYSHTSIAIADALETFEGLIYEVHISNIYSRESYRHFSYISPLANGVICGAGKLGYEIAIDAIKDEINNFNN